MAASAVDMAYRVASYAFKGYIGFSAIYVPAMAGSMLYLGARHPKDLLSHPGQTLMGGASFSNRVTKETVQEGRANVMAAFGSHIPADSACHSIVPVIGFQSPDASTRDSHLIRERNGQPTTMYLYPFASNAGALHTVHHEYVHCVTHPGFDKAIRKSEHWRTLNEALTEYFADQLPGSWIGKLGVYDFSKLANGKRLKAAAAELEATVGKEVLRKAFFAGDPQAISQVTDAVLDIWPKRPNFSAWPMVRWLPRHQQQALGECFVGLSLLDQQKLPTTSHSVWASQLLPVWTFDSISKQQAQRMQEQAEEARNRFGRPFDRAFCHTDPEVQAAAMQKIGEELARWWKTVL
ncbi:hypothetical protein [Paracidovorax avenae]|uniref:hypothetical protein n=1 Tax=Paracidovorax avenae TaxID=80867 RepID=UPI001314156D|nr:hypothetical protein [Paracidovorax avenae]